ncbi:MAG: AsnC family transcriptional regulator [Stappia sp.]|uniref:Lrp/AsnC family transcriptional regulator n=1 Tax=Stappia sp. TaxID=1870903 RepID=UPI000C636773|nr:Lrp/AsnC family transcriptional regulator [Stappia sp.]MAA98627.1 AsnC family transcriptional regulator [Stappia sp.]MBM20544.1 AsnC family transcriptional regulator [Stappia sp.]
MTLARDALDRQLIALLQMNARMPTAEIARRLGLARSTVHERIARLERERVISGYTAVLARGLPGEAVRALVMLAIEQQRIRDTLKRLETFPEIRTCLTISGEFDVFLVVEAPRLEDLDEALDEIAAVPGVRRSQSSIVLASKFDRRPNTPQDPA